jgi:hypothetical protein
MASGDGDPDMYTVATPLVSVRGELNEKKDVADDEGLADATLHDGHGSPLEESDAKKMPGVLFLWWRGMWWALPPLGCHACI